MAFKNTYFNVTDNTGVQLVKCIQVYRSPIALPASLLLVSLKKVLPNRKLQKGQLYKAVVVRLKRVIKRSSGITVRYSKNAVVILKKNELVPLGTRIFGSVYIEVRRFGFMKIISLASFVA